MTWARLDDLLPVHPKVRALTDAAFRLYICAICWSNQHLTDGHVPAGQLRYLSDVRRPLQCAEQLITAGLWEPNGDGWMIHDYLDYQASADKVRQDRDAKRQRQERWKANREITRDASGDASGDAPPIPIPSHPIPSPEGSVVTNLSDRSEPLPDLMAIQAVQKAVQDRTGKRISTGDARSVAAKIIGTESVRNPAAYLNAAIMRDPNPSRFLPPPSSMRKPKPAWCGMCDRDTRLTGPADQPYRCPNCHPLIERL
jgi:hypothetical protein